MQRNRAGCEEKSGDVTVWCGENRADVQAEESMVIRSNKRLGMQELFPELAVEEAAEKVKKLR